MLIVKVEWRVMAVPAPQDIAAPSMSMTPIGAAEKALNSATPSNIVAAKASVTPKAPCHVNRAPYTKTLVSNAQTGMV